VIDAPRGRHSEKPDFVFDMIERQFPHLLKIELNRRGAPRPGWAAWGNEVEAA
jgi:N6-adenosine-specific RNA methylase IME4